jgi:hypothetical protein
MRAPLAVAVAAAIATIVASTAIDAETDLDAFMREVVAKRDVNWKKLQQYVLDERESIDVRGPGNVPIWGERRDYTWYIRDGFFVRSPLRVNGVEISDADRRTFEAEYLKRQQEREKRAQRGQVGIGPSGVIVDAPDRGPAAVPDSEAPSDVDGILKQTRQPQFISSAYFLRFRFEEGRYALVGRETLDGREALRVEYYPTKLFGGTDRRRNRRDAERSDENKAYDAEFQRLMNKVALVTLWIDPAAHQIVKYTFDNVGFDFLPVQWLVHVDTLQASMRMGQPFPDVWLPRDLTFSLVMTLAIGQIDVRYGLEYHDYRRPDISTKVKIR